MALNSKLNAAKSVKNDEFYTQYSDVVKELGHYKAHFRDKVVYCNCDAPHSAFVRYFDVHFTILGLKALISSSIDGVVTYRKRGGSARSYQLPAGGDFGNKECIAMLKQCDIVVTNPPFSLFRRFLALLMACKKDFLLLGSLQGLTYKEVWPLVFNGDVGLGVNINDIKYFESPNNAAAVMHDGKPMVRFSHGTIVWYTTLRHGVAPQPLPLVKKFSEGHYPLYDGFEIRECSKLSDIPYDYNEPIGVPMTYMLRHNSDVFDLLGRDLVPYGVQNFKVNGTNIYKRVVVRLKPHRERLLAKYGPAPF